MSNPQQQEIEKYKQVYQHENYRMGDARRLYAEQNVRSATDCCDTYLDVGCGRGEMVRFAENLGYHAIGLEAVDYLTSKDKVFEGLAWDMPFKDNSFDLVTMFDVIEHLLPEDTERTLAELRRVAGKQLFITAANYSSKSLGVELHVNRRSYEEWDKILRKAFEGDHVEWLPRKHGINSETWHILLSE